MTVVHPSDGNISVWGNLPEMQRVCRCPGYKQKFTVQQHRGGRWNENSLFVKVEVEQLMMMVRHFESVLSANSSRWGSDMVTSEWR